MAAINNANAVANTINGIPTHLKHKPVMAYDYRAIKNRHDKQDGDDALYISIGHAQYDYDSASVKIMRHTGAQWSPQSEEVPIQRVPYMMALLLVAIYKKQNPNCKDPISDQMNDSVVKPGDMDFLCSAIEEWSDYLKDGIECVNDLLRRIDVSKIGK